MEKMAFAASSQLKKKLSHWTVGKFTPENDGRVIQRAVVQRCSVKKLFLEISQNSQENTCGRVSFFLFLVY